MGWAGASKHMGALIKSMQKHVPDEKVREKVYGAIIHTPLPDVGALLLVTTLAKLCRLPDSIAGKPARAVRLAGAFG